VGGRIDPLALVVDAGESVNGADNVSGGYVEATLGFVDDVTQREAKIAVADGKEIQGVGVAVDRALLDAIDIPDFVGTMPMDEFLFDVFAVRMAADGAAGFVRGLVQGPGRR
jgi:hypothetical protein